MTSQTANRRIGFQTTTLENGLRVVTSEMAHTHSVSIGIYIGVGSRYEGAEQAGISHFIEHLLFKGTRRRPTPREISVTIEASGGVLNAGTEQELTVYWCKVAEPYHREALDLLIDMLRNSLFESESVERERMVVIEELGMNNDYPAHKVDALIDEMLWPDHPLGRDIGGTKDSVALISRDAMLEHVARYYAPPNIVVSVAGNVAHEEVVDQLDALCDGWAATAPSGWTPFEGDQSAPQLRFEYRKTEQANLALAVPGVALQHADRYPVDLLSVILGEGMSSRLFVEVREEKGLAYDIHSGVAHFRDCGAFVVAAGVDPDRIYDAVQIIVEQLSNLRDGVLEEELDKAKRLTAGRLLLRMEDTRAVSAWMGAQALLLGHISDTDEVLERIDEVTLDQVAGAANTLLVTERLNLAVVGPSRHLRRLQRLLAL